MAAATALVSTVLAFSPGCSSGGGGGGLSGPGGPGDPGDPGDPGGLIGEVRVLNETSAAGPAVASVVLPLHQGAYRRVPRVRTETGAVCQVAGLGPKWPDGSLRTVRVDLPVDAAANSVETLKLQVTSGPDPAFVMHPAVKKALPAMGRGFEVNKTTNSFETSYLIEDGPLVQVFRAGTRARNSMMWAELDILYYANMPHARFVLTWGNSDPSNQALFENPGEVWFEINGPKVIVDGAAGKVLQRSEVGGLTRLKLYAGGDIGDGQAQALDGQLVFAGDDPPVLHALAKGWVETRAFGPFGELLPQIMPTEQEYSDWVQKQVKQKLDPWAEPIHGCVSDPGATGNQPDFGTIVMRPDLLLGDPRRLPAIRRSIYQEACRPTHFRELSKAPVTLPNHPKLITHRGRPHWRAGNWIDTLGKPRAYLTRTAHAPGNRVWSGHDNEHWSVNYLCAYALTTGDRWAIAECHHKVEMWLSQFTTKTGTGNDKPGPARAVGRGLLAGCWLYLVTGREEIRDRILTRNLDLRPQVSKARPPEVKLRVLAPRWTRQLGHYWAPWEEGMAVTSMMAVHKMFGVTDAKTLAVELSDVITMHAFGKVNGSWRIGYKIPFQHGNGKVYIPDNDPNWASKYAAGSGLTIWGLAAVVVAAEHSGRQDVRARAVEILKQQLNNVTGTSDRLQWVCVSGSAAAHAAKK